MAAAIRQNEREAGDVKQLLAIVIMDNQLYMLGIRDERQRWADVIVNLAEKGVTLPQLTLTTSYRQHYGSLGTARG
jgi:hypothetical protein